MTDRKLRSDLLKKLGRITPQALSKRVQIIKRKYPMTTEDATYVIAHNEGIILDRYLDIETMNHIGELIRNISPIQPVIKPRSKLKARLGAERDQRVIVMSKDFKITDPILHDTKIQEAKAMAEMYPFLYILENSIRQVIDQVMISKHGKNWWNSQAPSGLEKKVAGRMASEKKNSWHQRRGSRPIDYLNLNQLPALMRKIEQDVVPNIIPSIDWFTQLVNEIYQSRCVVCHMNPLAQHNIQAVKLKFGQWQRQIKANKNLISNVSP